jgi:renalase
MMPFPDESLSPKSCLIIGGGISGLIAGTVLQRSGINVTLLDKGRGIGGRLATRRISHPTHGTGVFDYGAQFFTVSDPSFQTWIDDWLQAGIVKIGSHSPTGAPRYRGVTSNRSIAQHLAQTLDVRTQTRAVSLTWASSGWIVQTVGGADFIADALLITSPVPQSLELLAHSAIPLPLDIKSRLEQITYQPCLALLALLEQPSLVPEPGGLPITDAALAWIACHPKTGISPHGNAVTLQAMPEFSRAHWDDDPAAVAEILLQAAAPWLGSAVVDYQLHRWRYSQPQSWFGATHLALRSPGPLLFAGDAFAAGRPAKASLNLENAARSGLATAHDLLQTMAER